MQATEASNLTNSTIAAYAERVGDHYGVYDPDGKADIDRLMVTLGGAVALEDDAESLDVRNEGDFTVFVPRFTSERRDRFTIAHELGHYFLHYLYPKVEGPKQFFRGGRNRAETEANVFASSLLMPAEKFKAAHEECGGNAWTLSVLFDVSPAAAEVRAQVLNL